MSKLTKITIIVLITINILLGAWYILHGDLLFHTDIARDFLLIEDIAYVKHLTLIGPRSGGISGVFHGPAWLYLNLPAFLLGKGNPVFVGWFWFILYLSFMFITYKVGVKLFDKKTGILSVLLISLIAASSVKNLFNPFGAVLLSPVFFYFFWEYLKKQEYKNLLISFFILGLIIQFQMAFGGPILVLTVPLLIYFLYKKKKLSHLTALLILLIPLSTYILFDLKHDFLQTRSVIQSITATEKKPGDQILPVFIFERIKGLFVNGLKIQPVNNLLLDLPITLIFTIIFLKVYQKKKFKNRNLYFLFFYYYIGFWILSFLFRGVMWGYYYWPFLPLIIIVFASSRKLINKKIFYLICIYILVINYFQQVIYIKDSQKAIGKDGGSWQFNFQLSKKIFQEAKGDFGYFIYTPDLFGYSTRYALNYTQTLFNNKKAYPFEKRQITYVIIAPPPDNKPYLNGEWWRKNQVKITKQPEEVYQYKNGFKIEKYILTEKERIIQADPNLIQSIFFR